jgi:hypothetical protein
LCRIEEKSNQIIPKLHSSVADPDPNPDLDLPESHVFGLPDPDPDPLVRGMDPSIIKVNDENRRIRIH